MCKRYLCSSKNKSKEAKNERYEHIQARDINNFFSRWTHRRIIAYLYRWWILRVYEMGIFKYTRRERREKKSKEVKVRVVRCILRIVSVSYRILLIVFSTLYYRSMYLCTYVSNSQLNRETDLTACPAFTSQSKHRVQLCIHRV